MTSTRTRQYTDQYSKISAQSVRSILCNTSSLCIVNNKHQPSKLVANTNNKFILMLRIQNRTYAICLSLDCRSASKKLYLVCPYCGKQRQYLYLKAKTHGCRTCLGLNYACQSETKLARLARKIRKKRQLIWGDRWLGLNNLCDNSFLWPKPKWMRFRTFDANASELHQLEEQYLKLSLKQFEHLFKFKYVPDTPT